jgi:hypothetical protein
MREAAMALLVVRCGGSGSDDDDSGEVGRRRRRATRMRVHGQGAMVEDSLLPLLHTSSKVACIGADECSTMALQHLMSTDCILSPCPEATQRARRSVQLHQRMKRASLGGRRAHSNRLPSLCPRSPLSLQQLSPVIDATIVQYGWFIACYVPLGTLLRVRGR